MRFNFVFAPLIALCAVAFPAYSQQAKGPVGKTMPFQQMISVRYPRSAALPQAANPPAPPVFDFVAAAKLPPGVQILSAAKAASGVVWVITDKGVFRSEGETYVPLTLPRAFKPFQPQINADTVVREVASDTAGHLWAATSHGLIVSDGDQWWQSIDHRDGMPYIALNCLFLAQNGDVWGGTNEGAWRLRDGKFDYFHGKRWLPGNKIERIWPDNGGVNGVYLLTEAGTAHLEEKPMTLAQKAAHFERITAARHNRRGYVTGSGLKAKGDPEKGAIFDASDNDGLWTALYIGAESLRYAVTKDPVAKALAKKSMDALLDLERLTGIPGFPARALVTDAEIKAGVTGFDPEETVRIYGETTKIWFKSRWKKASGAKAIRPATRLTGIISRGCSTLIMSRTRRKKRVSPLSAAASPTIF